MGFLLEQDWFPNSIIYLLRVILKFFGDWAIFSCGKFNHHVLLVFKIIESDFLVDVRGDWLSELWKANVLHIVVWTPVHYQIASYNFFSERIFW